MNIRKPAVAGRFYPSDPDDLRDMIRLLENKSSCTSPYGKISDEKMVGSVVPHAGYIYSGMHASCFFRLIRSENIAFDTAVIIHPLHASWGGHAVSDDHDAWETPLGIVNLDQEFIREAGFPVSSRDHLTEHSAEVQVPFLQYYAASDFNIVPLGMKDQTPEEAANISGQLLKAERKLGRKILILASSDFSHYIDPTEGYRKDQLVLDMIMDMDPPAVYRVVHEANVSACGYGPIMCLMEYAKEKCGIPDITILSRGNSGEVHPAPEVVDYITIMFACH